MAASDETASDDTAPKTSIPMTSNEARNTNIGATHRR